MLLKISTYIELSLISETLDICFWEVEHSIKVTFVLPQIFKCFAKKKYMLSKTN